MISSELCWAAYNGGSTLKQNSLKQDSESAHQEVDLIASKKYNNFLLGLSQKMVDEGKTLQECLADKEEYEADDNFLIEDRVVWRKINWTIMKYTENFSSKYLNRTPPPPPMMRLIVSMDLQQQKVTTQCSSIKMKSRSTTSLMKRCTK
jgi:hypothetical protein